MQKTKEQISIMIVEENLKLNKLYIQICDDQVKNEKYPKGELTQVITKNLIEYNLMKSNIQLLENELSSTNNL